MITNHFIKSQCTLSNNQRVCRHYIRTQWRQDTVARHSRRYPNKSITHNRRDTVSIEQNKLNKSVDLYSILLTW